MDFLDPKKERLNRIALFVSYGLVALAIGIASMVLLYQTDGYCVDGKGSVDRCGLVFVSSQPSGANIYVDGKLRKARTNTKMNLQSGTYALQINRPGYRDWRRQVTVLGGDVQRYDYPLLLPVSLSTNDVASFTSSIVFGSQSPDRRWLIMAEDAQALVLHVYDLKTSDKPVASTVTIPTAIVTTGDAEQSWKAVEWSSDNRHLLLLHGYVSGGVQSQEYILLDRQTPLTSRNITRDLSLVASDEVQLFDKKPTQYYVYNTENKTLHTTAIGDAAPTTLQLARVLAYKTYADDTVLYATDTPPSGKITAGKVSIVLQQANQTRVLRQLAAGATTYLLDIARYAGDWYVVIGADSEKGVQVYRNPLDEALASASSVPAPIRFLKVAAPTYVAFSANTQYVLAENGQSVAVYDAEYGQAYNFSLSSVIDSPQTHVSWMDGNRLSYVSEGKLQVADYDNENTQTLQQATATLPVFFSPDYKAVYNMWQSSDGVSSKLTQTSLIAR